MRSVYAGDIYALIYAFVKKMLDVSVRSRYKSVPYLLIALEMELYLESLANGNTSLDKLVCG
jgi:hypothetical protein